MTTQLPVGEEQIELCNRRLENYGNGCVGKASFEHDERGGKVIGNMNTLWKYQ